MDKRRLGHSELYVSRLGLGGNNFGWRLDLKATHRVVDASLDAGINFFDTADVYGERSASERYLGTILQGRRDRVVLATKFGRGVLANDEPSGSRAYLSLALEASLRRLRTDWVDLYYYHRPDGVTPLAETLGAMQGLVDEGKIRAIGCSNLSVQELADAHAAGASVAALQNQYNLLDREAEAGVLPRCREYGISFIPYFPLASGLLSGRYQRYGVLPASSRVNWREAPITDETFDRIEALEQFARERGRQLAELAVASLVSTPGVSSVVAGASSPEQVRGNCAAAEWTLSLEELLLLP
jgi:aryl-alcohol dehydrogenase-like predicted oxidoreductase